MRPDRHELKQTIVQVARDTFRDAPFARRQLMLKVEQHLRAQGDWESSDDRPSKSAGQKSKGLAEIDFAITDLAAEHKLEHLSRDTWRVSKNGESANGSSALAVQERLRRLALVTARSRGVPLPLGAARRENLYGDRA